MIFGTTSGGDTVTQHEISDGDLSVTLLSWGAAIHDVRLTGVPYNLTLNSPDIHGYENELVHYGTLIGPIANRISPARISIDGMTYELERNATDTIHLHSGKGAAHRQNWTATQATDTAVTFRLSLIDGACGLPGNRDIEATFEIAAPATLRLTISASTDANTVMNFANHSYWNLDGSEDFSGHSLQIDADRYLPVDGDALVTGEIADVTGTAMDFRTARPVTPKGPDFDHNFCLSDENQPLRDVMTLRGSSGVQLTMATDQTGLQVYDARSPARPGRQAYEGLAFEAQAWPNAPHNPGFPSISITPDAPYRQVTQWQFTKIA